MINDLRRIAEQRVSEPAVETQAISADEAARLVYELEIHMEELEIQNEELRRTHLELKDSRDRYLDLYDFGPVGYLTLDQQGIITAANLTACEMLNHERSQLIGMSLLLLCDLNSRTELRRHFDEVIATENRCSTELKFADGTVHVHLESCRSTDPRDGQRHCRTVLTDITQRKLAELALAEKDEHLRSLADALPVLISYLDPDLRIRYCNAAYQQWFGVKGEELIGRRIQSLFAGRRKEFDDYLADVLDGRRVDFESSVTHNRHGERQTQMIFVPDITARGTVKGVHGLCIDVTERKLVEQQNSRRRDFSERLACLNADEKDVYKLLIQGKSNKVIAFELNVGLRTAERRRKTIFEKLKVGSMAELLQQLTNIQGIQPS